MKNEEEMDEQKELLANFFYTHRLLASILGQWKLFVEENQEIEILSLQKSKKFYLQRNFNRFQFYSYHHLHYHQQQCKKSKLFHFILLQIKYFKRWIFHHQKYYRQHPFHSIKIANQRNRKLQNYLIRKNKIKYQELFFCWKDRVFSRISLFRRLRQSSSSLCLQVFQSLRNAVNQRKKQDRLRQQYFVIKKKLRKKQSFGQYFYIIFRLVD